MRNSAVIILPITLVLLLQGSSAFTAVQKRDRPAAVAFGPTNNNAASSSPPATHPQQHRYINNSPFGLWPLSSSTSSSAVAQEEFSYWGDDADDNAVDLSFATIVLACTLSVALGFGLGYGT
jgi:hypothetical protein